VAASYWSCTCGNRWPRTRQKCDSCGKRRPKRRVPKHAATLRDQTWDHYNVVNAEIHGVTDGSCAVCGRPEHESMHHHREHDHVTGLPRGLACFQCNGLMPRLLTLERARLIVAYLERVESFYAGQRVAS
jgi:hypothetical protein